MFRFCLILFCGTAVTSLSLASDVTIGPNGINSAAFQEPGVDLTGMNIGIGQVEIERPGLPGSDPDMQVHMDVIPAGVFRRDGAAQVADIHNHAMNVAGVMISRNEGSLAGVAKDAELYASAIVAQGPGGEQVLVTNNHVATSSCLLALMIVAFVTGGRRWALLLEEELNFWP